MFVKLGLDQNRFRTIYLFLIGTALARFISLDNIRCCQWLYREILPHIADFMFQTWVSYFIPQNSFTSKHSYIKEGWNFLGTIRFVSPRTPELFYRVGLYEFFYLCPMSFLSLTHLLTTYIFSPSRIDIERKKDRGPISVVIASIKL